MLTCDTATMQPPTLSVILRELEEADGRLRALYRDLAENPDLAEQHEATLRELHAKRRDLAERTGLALLAERRANERVDADGQFPPEEVPAESSTAVLTPAAEPEAGDDDSRPRASVAEPEPLASERDVAEWKRTIGESGVGRVSYADRFAEAWDTALDALMVRLGPPRELDLELTEELDALDAVGRMPLVREWSALPRDIQQTWLAMLVARTRATKEIEGLAPAQRGRVREIISRYPPWAAAHQPGHVHGLRVDHDPMHESWAEDGRQLWQALKRKLEPRALGRSPVSTSAKRAPPSQDLAAGEQSERVLDPSWPLLPLTRGRHGVLVGGDPREPNRERLERLFQLQCLEWPDVAGPRKVDALIERIRRRSIDIVIVLRGFIDHKQSEPVIAAAKESGVAWVLADGYGSAAIKAGLERFLGAQAREPC